MTDDEFRAAAERSADLCRRREHVLRLLGTINAELAELTEQMMFYAGG